MRVRAADRAIRSRSRCVTSRPAFGTSPRECFDARGRTRKIAGVGVRSEFLAMSAPERNGTSIVWMRRDLRLADHAALFEAAIRSAHVVCAFVLDPVLLRGPRMGPP